MSFHSFQQKFSDIDEMCEKMHGWNIHLLPLAQGKQTHAINHFSSKYVVVQNLRIGQKAHHVGATSKQRVTFGLPSISGTHVDLNGSPINDSLVIFSQGAEFSSVSPAGYSPTAISIDRAWLQQFAMSHELPINMETIDIKHAIIHISPKRKMQLRRLFFYIASEQYTNEARRHVLVFILPLLLLRITLENEQLKTLKLEKKIKALTLAFNFIQLNAQSPLSIKNISDASHLKERSLERAFKEYLDISPNNYLRLYRLQQARIMIKKSKGNIRITDIALICGFTHLGRFSHCYDSFFNELPRDTRKHSTLT
ncbi:MAG: helix-turn-helix transcriptional regulator [Candidatus Brocadiaceae bacterium]|nr:helix-turn-helix transcriptional regulator [Candidatus Brocadiaceae bacterium]